MATHRRKVPPKVKQELLAEAGEKCANPGCPNTLVQFHHIDEWAVYQTHDAASMIAVCATCHDHVHRGELPIDDSTIYRWKGVRDSIRGGHLYVAPAARSQLVFGMLTCTSKRRVSAFSFGGLAALKLDSPDGQIRVLDAVIPDEFGYPVFAVQSGHFVTPPRPDMRLVMRPGLLVLSARRDFVPPWIVERVRTAEGSAFGEGEEIEVLRLEVVAPGAVKVEGVFLAPQISVVASSGGLHFVQRGLPRPVTLVGDPRGSELECDLVTESVFGLG